MRGRAPPRAEDRPATGRPELPPGRRPAGRGVGRAALAAAAPLEWVGAAGGPAPAPRAALAGEARRRSPLPGRRGNARAPTFRTACSRRSARGPPTSTRRPTHSLPKARPRIPDAFQPTRVHPCAQSERRVPPARACRKSPHAFSGRALRASLEKVPHPQARALKFACRGRMDAWGSAAVPVMMAFEPEGLFGDARAADFWGQALRTAPQNPASERRL